MELPDALPGEPAVVEFQDMPHIYRDGGNLKLSPVISFHQAIATANIHPIQDGAGCHLGHCHHPCHIIGLGVSPRIILQENRDAQCPLAADIFCYTPSVLIAFIFSLFVVLGWNPGLGCQPGNCATIGLYPQSHFSCSWDRAETQLSWHLRVSDCTRRRLCSEERMGVLHTHCCNSGAETGVETTLASLGCPRRLFATTVIFTGLHIRPALGA